MKFVIVVGVFAMFALTYSQPLLVDMVMQNNRPQPPVKKPMQPPIVIPTPELVEIEQPQPPMMIEEEDRHPSIPKIEGAEEIVHNIIDVIKHQPDDVEYFNGKVVPTPKYPRGSERD